MYWTRDSNAAFASIWKSCQDTVPPSKDGSPFPKPFCSFGGDNVLLHSTVMRLTRPVSGHHLKFPGPITKTCETAGWRVGGWIMRAALCETRVWNRTRTRLLVLQPDRAAVGDQPPSAVSTHSPVPAADGHHVVDRVCIVQVEKTTFKVRRRGPDQTGREISLFRERNAAIRGISLMPRINTMLRLCSPTYCYGFCRRLLRIPMRQRHRATG